jgi:hypothetical protein
VVHEGQGQESGVRVRAEPGPGSPGCRRGDGGGWGGGRLNPCGNGWGS